MQGMIAEIDSTCYEPGFKYWGRWIATWPSLAEGMDYPTGVDNRASTALIPERTAPSIVDGQPVAV